MSENTKAVIYRKMANVMGMLERVPKSGKNKQQNYEYATAEDVKDAARKAFAAQGLALMIELTDYEIIEIKSHSGTVGTKVRGSIKYSICCGETGEVISSLLPTEAIDFQDKAFSKLYTIGLKYFLIDTFMISTGDEPDPDGTAIEAVAATNGQRPAPAMRDGKPILDPRQAYSNKLRVLQAEIDKLEGDNVSRPLDEQWLANAPLEELKEKGTKLNLELKALTQHWEHIQTEAEHGEPVDAETEDSIPF